MAVLIPFVVAEKFTLHHSSSRNMAYMVCIAITVCVLGGLGVVKARFSKQNPVKSGFQYVAVGGLSAFVAFAISSAVSAYH